MRAAFNKKEILKDRDGIFYGINLGFDFCAEHEWGIKKLISYLGVNETLLGIDKRKQQVEVIGYNTCTFTKDKQKWIGFMLSSTYYGNEISKYSNKEFKDFLLKRMYIPYGKNPCISTAWDEKEFAIICPIEDRFIIDELVEAIKNKELVIGIGADANPFSRGGLLLMIESKIPQEIKDAVKEADVDYLKLMYVAFKKTKIENLLKRKKKEYYALSPKWANEEKTEVLYWLNPKDQQNVNYGWFTLADLRLWAKNKGPIPMKKEV